MDRLVYPFNQEWHVAINKHNTSLDSKEFKHWMYEAKTMADEVPRLALLFKKFQCPKIILRAALARNVLNALN
jgi:hypothetical protein